MTAKGTPSAQDGFASYCRAYDRNQRDIQERAMAKSPDDIVTVPNGPGISMTREKAERHGLTYVDEPARDGAETTCHSHVEAVARALCAEKWPTFTDTQIDNAWPAFRVPAEVAIAAMQRSCSRYADDFDAKLYALVESAETLVRADANFGADWFAVANALIAIRHKVRKMLGT